MRMSDVLYFAGIIVAIISIIISTNVKGRFNKWSKHKNARRISGKEVAERMLHNAGIYDVSVVQTPGTLTDHYDPRNKTVNLSDGVYDKATIASVAVAAHECGHAIQHKEGYAPLEFRNKLVPVANFGSKAGVWLFILGLVFSSMWLVDLGIVFFATCTLFAFITLPVEFNASSRALNVLRGSEILMESEMGGARSVLSAAAMTYVASAAASIIQLLRLITIRRND